MEKIAELIKTTEIKNNAEIFVAKKIPNKRPKIPKTIKLIAKFFMF